ncbi:DNA-binding transcriptional ArsR family regulator [Rhizobium skierniewicense]|uniref:DNA-binding transcriptional ArsR family regulator n=1 Tax=Rhizobium skierniewicense TaxID=984260 RepID=A0A7W6FZT6_9HYPH|nr:metalloregulator ArsR/SmtB family transcription factor [Rhizobium skierniewicense]MBB3944178.1 DNA-binding transcriptional ArsR family regulator [Rhizobium skierniewicense]
MPTLLSTEKVAIQAAKLLSAVANAKRLVILSVLSKQETSVGSLAEQVGLSQSALSQHLAKLRSAKLVDTRRDAQTIYYSCKGDRADRLLGVVQDIFGLPFGLMLFEKASSTGGTQRQLSAASV